MFTSNNSEVVDCDMNMLSYCLHFYFDQRDYQCSRRRPTLPTHLSIIIRIAYVMFQVRGGQTASFALKKIRISEVRKGQVLVDPALSPTSCWEFKVRVLVSES